MPSAASVGQRWLGCGHNSVPSARCHGLAPRSPDPISQECEQLIVDLVRSFLLNPVTAAGDDDTAQVRDCTFHGLTIDKAGGGVTFAADEQSGLRDGCRIEAPEVCPVTVEVPVPVERAAKSGPIKLRRVVAEVVGGQPSRKPDGLWNVIEQAGTCGQPAEQAGRKILGGVTRESVEHQAQRTGCVLLQFSL